MRNIIIAALILFAVRANGQGNLYSRNKDLMDTIQNIENSNYPSVFSTYSNPAWLTSIAWSKITGYIIPQDSVRFFNRTGKVNQVLRVFCDTISVSTASGGTVDISSAGFSSVLSVAAVAYKNTGTATSVSAVGIKSYNTTSITLNFTEGNSSLINLLGSNVLLGPSNNFASTSGLYLSIIVIGY